MSGIIGAFGDSFESFEKTQIINTINPLSICETNVFKTDFGFLANAVTKNAELKNTKYYENSIYLCCLNGELIDQQEVPWESIINNIEQGRFERFVLYKSPFVIIVINKKSKSLSIVSDRVSFKPIFYLIAGKNIVFSTTISSFCQLSKSSEFNMYWLYEFIFFNYPICQTTVLKNVKRMPPASVLRYEIHNQKFAFYQYAENFKKVNGLLRRKDGIKKAFEVFNERVPKYFESTNDVACGLSGGLDSRTIISFIPEKMREHLRTYTFGIGGCFDLLESAKISKVLEIPHYEVVLDDRFTEELPKLIYETVYLSSGIQYINRSHLLYVYRKLTDNGNKFSAIVTGDSGDHLFRDHIRGQGNIPHIIPHDMMYIFGTGNKKINTNFYKNIFLDNDYNDFLEYINSILDKIRIRYGDFNLPETYLTYLVYEAAPKYLGGDASLVDNFSTFRSPYWDTDIIKLSFQIEYGTLGFSENLRKQDRYRESVLQANLVQNNPYLSAIAYKGYPINIFSKNNKLAYKIFRIAKKGPKRILMKKKNFSYPPIDDWRNWHHTVLNNEINKMFTKNSLICNYMSWKYIKELIEKANRQRLEKIDTLLLGKITTAEIILNLIENRWRI